MIVASHSSSTTEESSDRKKDSLKSKMETKEERMSDSEIPICSIENEINSERDERYVSFIPLNDLSNLRISANPTQDAEASKIVHSQPLILLQAKLDEINENDQGLVCRKAVDETHQLYVYNDSESASHKLEEIIRNEKVEHILMVENLDDIMNQKLIETSDGIVLELNQSVIDQIHNQSLGTVILSPETNKDNRKGKMPGLTETFTDLTENDTIDEDTVVKDVTPEKELPPTFTLDDDFDDDCSGLLRGFSTEECEQKANKSLLAKARKITVGVAGSALILVGLPLIPAPTPGGVVVVGGGMALLATEFPQAARALDKTRERLAKAVAEDPDDHDDESEGKENAKSSSTPTRKPTCSKQENHGPTEYSITGTPLRHGSRVSKHSKEYMDEVQEVRKKATKAMKDTKQSVKRFIRGNILPIMEKMSKRVTDEAKVGRSTTSSTTSQRISSMRGNNNSTVHEI
jgi:hypothetical protein